MAQDAPETLVVETTRVSCEGAGGALGHPKIYLEIGEKQEVECPYCDKRFVLKEGAGHGASLVQCIRQFSFKKLSGSSEGGLNLWCSKKKQLKKFFAIQF